MQPNMQNMQNIQNTMTGGAASQHTVIQDNLAPVFVKPVIPSILETETIEAMLNKIETDLFGNKSHDSHESHVESHDPHDPHDSYESHDLQSINNSSIKRVIA